MTKKTKALTTYQSFASDGTPIRVTIPPKYAGDPAAEGLAAVKEDDRRRDAMTPTQTPGPPIAKAHVGNPHDIGAEETANLLSLDYKDHVFEMSVFSGNLKQSKAVLDEIVQACNSHDALLEALQYLVHVIGQDNVPGNIVALIAQAEGGKS